MNWKSFVDRTERLYTTIARQYLKNDDDVKDVVQQVYISLYEKRDVYTEDDAYRAGRTATKHKAINMWHKNQKSIDDALFDIGVSPNQIRMDNQEYAEALLYNPTHRKDMEFLRMFAYGYGIKDVASSFGVSTGRVRSGMHRARDIVKRRAGVLNNARRPPI